MVYDKGKFALVYAQLLKAVWCGRFKLIIPHFFKGAVDQMNDIISGNNQHDSHELLMFVLDCLHEDLNRIICEPYVADIPNECGDDELISRESWRRFF